MPKIQMRHDTAANWKTANPTLASGEWSIETDTKKMKLGDGVTAYNSLDYFRDEDNEWEKPEEWIDIRSAALPNSVYFLVGHAADYSKYNEFGVSCTLTSGPTYDVYIDGRKRFTTSSESATKFSWSDMALTSGWDITYPEALRTHVVRITPSSSTDTIVRLSQAANTSGASLGTLWIHYTVANAISINNVASTSSGHYYSPKLEAVTSSTGTLQLTAGPYGAFNACHNLKTIPVIDLGGGVINGFYRFLNNASSIKTVTLKNGICGIPDQMFAGCSTLKTIKVDNASMYLGYNMFTNDYVLENIPPISTDAKRTHATDMLNRCSALRNLNLDLQNTNLERIGFGGLESAKIDGLRGITISNECLLNSATSPQLNVSYTGLDRPALVNLFKSMPYNVAYEKVGNPTIVDGVVSGITENDYIQLNQAVTFGNNFEIVMKLIGPSNNPDKTYQYLFSNSGGNSTTGFYGLMILLNSGRYLQYNASSTGSSWDIGTYSDLGSVISAGDSLYVKLAYDGTNYIVSKSTDGTSWSQLTSTPGTSFVDSTRLPIFGRNLPYATDAIYPGGIDLNHTYIKVNGVTWFNGASTRQLSSDLINVGNVTVTNGTEASSFANNKYLYANKTFAIDLNVPITMLAKIKTGSDISGYQNFIKIPLSDTATSSIGIQGSGTMGWIFPGNTFIRDYSKTVTSNTIYYVKASIESNMATLYYNTTGFDSEFTKIGEKDVSSLLGTTSIKVNFGGNMGGNNFKGSIYFDSMAISVNGISLMPFTQPMTKTCSIVGTTGELDLTAQDKAIVLNKGWALTTNNTN